MGKLNELLKESMIEGHALSFAYNLYNSKKGTSIEHLTKILFDEDGLRKELTCLESLHELSPVRINHLELTPVDSIITYTIHLLWGN